ncbi:phosphodiester glycosidase family protein [Peribacillus frigoritolerans]|uniref:phosphodiester glycosidase family protein n=1 Tax=Peribacillus frigoritolerans TaxID=450367 RepID=UPI0036440B92
MPYIERPLIGGNVVVNVGHDEAARADIVELQETDIVLQEKDAETDALLAETVFYDEITFEKFRDNTSRTDYYLTTIPNTDSKGNLIKLERGFPNDVFNSGTGDTARSFAIRKITSFIANASTFDTTTLQPRGMQIHDGVVLQENLINPSNRYFLGIKDDNTLVAYPPSTTSAQMLAEGCVQALTGFYPMIENGLAVDASIYSGESNSSVPNPRAAIAQMPNKDIVFFTCEGRSNKDLGMTYADMIRILLAKGVTFAYNLDGGGSSQTLVRGVLLNNPIDGGGKTERLVPDFLYVKKPSTNPQNIANLNKDIGIVNKRLKDLTWDLLGMESSSKKGTITFNSDGVAASKTIPHGLSVIPSYFQVSPLSAATGTAGIKYVTADATNLTVFFNAAPVTGTNNIVLSWKAEV